MDTTTIWLLLVVAAAVGLLAVILILRGERRRAAAAGGHERIFAASTEGATICPKCAGDNLWSDERCRTCGAKLR